MSTMVVIRPLVADGRILQPGDLVDVSGWRNARLLEQQRWIGRVPPPDTTRPAASGAAVSPSAAAPTVPAAPAAKTTKAPAKRAARST